jgi:hypothetical protein
MLLLNLLCGNDRQDNDVTRQLQISIISGIFFIYHSEMAGS